MKYGPKTRFAEELHATKYRAPGESFEESMNRVAAALTESSEEFHAVRDIMRAQRFLPGGRIQSAVGSPKQVTPYNCFVSGTIEDSFVDGAGSIMARAAEAATTMRMGGGIGYDFSTLRPRGATIRKLDSSSSGPVSFMTIFDSICKCIASSGHRRGAQMGVMRVDHPDIEEFIHVKQNRERLTGFNVSVAVTDEFMQAVETGDRFALRWGGETYRNVDARALWDKIMRSTWDWAEPGVLFIDQINRMNNLAYCETIAATNPCGEQPLPPHGACLLGSFNLTTYIRGNAIPEFPAMTADPGFRFDLAQFAADIPPIVAAMDQVVDVATYPMFEQEKEAKAKRRMGIGITGLANAGEALGYRYGSAPFLTFMEAVLRVLRDAAYRASIELAKERGPFPLFNADKYLASGFALTLPDGVREEIRKHGIRNSHLLSIAPTGTISMCADNVSSGIEPVFAARTRRTVQTFDGPVEEVLEDYGLRTWGVEPTECANVTAHEHLGVLGVATQFVDSAVSKTCNIPSTMAWEEFKQFYLSAWKIGAKGCTTYRLGGKREGILVAEPEEGGACKIDAETGRRDCD